MATDFDAQIRIYGIWFKGVFWLSLWMAFNIKTFGPVLQIVFSVMAIAGVLRIYTIVTAGEFPTTTLVGAVVEIATQLFIPWHRYVLKQELPEQKAGGVLMLQGDTPKQIEY
ncbi:DUF4345 domain-containing protein [Octadecabacter sp. SW4]|uniref:DUF4345 family protein n=1 Tax=Octadecabacter sp. SW4 TaxID=2602067 RepID=UPI0011C1D6F8|nr:DUF4345 family protein [Octadecabacter sp. SW4]QEE36744.1 DUF4345 domain-containing protein [Octadecabacter sp. SW4]